MQTLNMLRDEMKNNRRLERPQPKPQQKQQPRPQPKRQQRQKPKAPAKPTATRLFQHNTENGAKVALWQFEAKGVEMFRVTTVHPDGEIHRRDFTAAQLSMKLRTKKSPKKKPTPPKEATPPSRYIDTAEEKLASETSTPPAK